MKHVFILNPIAGKKQPALKLKPQLEAFFEAHPMDHEFYVTSCAGEATEIARRVAAEGPARFYACGGDGTVLETLNGMWDMPGAELACIPCGSGNDFLRFMPDEERFRLPVALIGGTARPVDLIRCNDRLSLNICSMGMDATVADRMVHYKRWPLVSGPMAYNIAVVRTFCGPIGQQLHIEIDTENGKVERDGEYLFALAANGQYYGGGYHGSPMSQPNDGVLEFILVKDLNHLQVLRFLGTYKRGEHLPLPCCESFRGTRMHVTSAKPAVVTADGECFSTTDVEFSIVPNAVSFVYPAAEDDDLLKIYEKSEIFQIGT